MRVLVTGGAGFIGSNLVPILIGAGHTVGVVDDLSTGFERNLDPRAWSRIIDICDAGLHDTVAEFAPEAVVHLAAQVDVTTSMADPAFDHKVNVEGTRAVATAAREAGARLMLAASSAAVYGPDVPVPTPETAAKAPFNPYGEHKLIGEAVLAEAFSGDGRDYASLRVSNVYGPRQSALGEGGVVAIFARRMVLGETPVIYGDGGQTRDFVYVADVCAAIVAALTAPGPLATPGPDGHSYNISTGARIDVESLAGLLRAATGYAGTVAHEAERPGDVRDSALDPAKAAAALGWTAAMDLAEGIANTARWFQAEAR